ncbi:TSC complex subunit 1a [Alosa sapidissima]|uniref:TSC complex subunit 1a n=1 Tax=Alosa sapidissima TaxID=34773 RepID=UPI001C09C45C|nr:TSC complex subunit 1a [Alosa sapidissima]
MAKEQTSVFDLLPLLESTDLQQLQQTRQLVEDHLRAEKGSVLLNGLVDYYLESSSSQALLILTAVGEPQHKPLLEKLNDCLGRQTCRLASLTLLAHVIRRQPPWIHTIPRFPLFPTLLKCLKTDSDTVVLITGVLVVTTLLPMIPQPSRHLLDELFDVFGRLARWTHRSSGSSPSVLSIHLHAGIYSLFHRLYGMYPCNFVSYLRVHYSMKENVDTFEEVVKPMLEHVRIHPELVTGTKDTELDPTRWRSFETHDIVVECAKVSLDPKEASWEEGFSNMPDVLPVHLSSRALEGPPLDHSAYGSPCVPVRPPGVTPPRLGPAPSYTSTPLTAIQQSSAVAMGTQDSGWSPALHCGMTTPPRGASPTNHVPQSTSNLSGRVSSTSVDGKLTPLTTPVTGPLSPHPPQPHEAELRNQPASMAQCPQDDAVIDSCQSSVLQNNMREPSASENLTCSSGAGEQEKSLTLPEVCAFVRDQEEEEGPREEDAMTEELLSLTDSDASSTLHRRDTMFSHKRPSKARVKPNSTEPVCVGADTPNSLSTPERPDSGAAYEGQRPPWSTWPCFTPSESSWCDEATQHAPLPYEPLFDLALPKAAELFVERRTGEARRRGGVANNSAGDEQAMGSAVANSPLEMLDLLIQQGSANHDRKLRRLSMPSRPAEGPAPGKQQQHQQQHQQQSVKSKDVEELQHLRSQVQLLHTQLQFERHKREQHAIRNRRLLRRVINATALQEQNVSMKEQLQLQDVELQGLRGSLQQEQQHLLHLQEETQTSVTQLQEQLAQLHRECSQYASTMQELQGELEEREEHTAHLEAELQTARKNLTNMELLLSQLSLKLDCSERLEEQVSFLSQQLLLLGENHQLCLHKLDRLGPSATKEMRMLQSSWRKECDRARVTSVQQGQRLDGAVQRVSDLEAALSRKEQLILQQKKLLEDVKLQSREQLRASEGRYQAQKQVTQALEAELLKIYSQLEMERPTNHNRDHASNHLTGPTQADAHSPTKTRANGCGGGAIDTPLRSERPRGVQDVAASPLLSASPPSCSLLGRRARQLSRNMSDGLYDDEDEALLESSQSNTSSGCHCGEASPTSSGAQAEAQSCDHCESCDQQPANEGTRRLQDLHIMDYNELPDLS